MGFDFVNIRINDKKTISGGTVYTPVALVKFWVTGAAAGTGPGTRASSSLTFANGLLVETSSWGG